MCEISSSKKEIKKADGMQNRSRYARSNGVSSATHSCSYRENGTTVLERNTLTTSHCLGSNVHVDPPVDSTRRQKMLT